MKRKLGIEIVIVISLACLCGAFPVININEKGVKQSQNTNDIVIRSSENHSDNELSYRKSSSEGAITNPAVNKENIKENNSKTSSKTGSDASGGSIKKTENKVTINDEKTTNIENDEIPVLNKINSKVISLINSMRSQPLSISNTLNSYAKIRSYEISIKWSHIRPNGSRGVDLIDSNKMRNENLAKTIKYDYTGTEEDINELAQRIVNNWKNSPTHYESMMDNDCTKIGVKTYVVHSTDGQDGNSSMYIFYTAMMLSN